MIPSKKGFLANPKRYEHIDQTLIRHEYSPSTIGLLHLLGYCSVHRKLIRERTTSSLLLQGLLVTKGGQRAVDRDELSDVGSHGVGGMWVLPHHSHHKHDSEQCRECSCCDRCQTPTHELVACPAVKSWMGMVLSRAAHCIDRSLNTDELNKGIAQHHKPEHARKKMRVNEDYKAAIVEEVGSGSVSSCSKLVVAKGHGEHQQPAKQSSETIQARLLAMREAWASVGSVSIACDATRFGSLLRVPWHTLCGIVALALLGGCHVR